MRLEWECLLKDLALCVVNSKCSINCFYFMYTEEMRSMWEEENKKDNCMQKQEHFRNLNSHAIFCTWGQEDLRTGPKASHVKLVKCLWFEVQDERASVKPETPPYSHGKGGLHSPPPPPVVLSFLERVAWCLVLHTGMPVLLRPSGLQGNQGEWVSATLLSGL